MKPKPLNAKVSVIRAWSHGQDIFDRTACRAREIQFFPPLRIGFFTQAADRRPDASGHVRPVLVIVKVDDDDVSPDKEHFCSETPKLPREPRNEGAHGGRRMQTRPVQQMSATEFEIPHNEARANARHPTYAWTRISVVIKYCRKSVYFMRNNLHSNRNRSTDSLPTWSGDGALHRLE